MKAHVEGNVIVSTEEVGNRLRTARQILERCEAFQEQWTSSLLGGMFKWKWCRFINEQIVIAQHIASKRFDVWKSVLIMAQPMFTSCLVEVCIVHYILTQPPVQDDLLDYPATTSFLAILLSVCSVLAIFFGLGATVLIIHNHDRLIQIGLRVPKELRPLHVYSHDWKLFHLVLGIYVEMHEKHPTDRIKKQQLRTWLAHAIPQLEENAIHMEAYYVSGMNIPLGKDFSPLDAPPDIGNVHIRSASVREPIKYI